METKELVLPPLSPEVRKDDGDGTFVDPSRNSFFAVGEPLKIAALEINRSRAIIPSGTFDDLRYSISGDIDGFFANAKCLFNFTVATVVATTTIIGTH